MCKYTAVYRVTENPTLWVEFYVLPQTFNCLFQAFFSEMPLSFYICAQASVPHVEVPIWFPIVLLHSHHIFMAPPPYAGHPYGCDQWMLQSLLAGDYGFDCHCLSLCDEKRDSRIIPDIPTLNLYISCSKLINRLPLWWETLTHS